MQVALLCNDAAPVDEVERCNDDSFFKEVNNEWLFCDIEDKYFGCIDAAEVKELVFGEWADGKTFWDFLLQSESKKIERVCEEQSKKRTVPTPIWTRRQKHQRKM